MVIYVSNKSAPKDMTSSNSAESAVLSQHWVGIKEPKQLLTAARQPHPRPPMDLTGFLFGNVNEAGELEDESLLDKVDTLVAQRNTP